MEPGAELEERSHAAASLDEAGRRRQDPGDQLEQRRLAAAVRTDEPNGRSRLHVEAHVAQRPELLDLLLAAQMDEPLLERLVVMQEKLLRHVIYPNDGGHDAMMADHG